MRASVCFRTILCVCVVLPCARVVVPCVCVCDSVCVLRLTVLCATVVVCVWTATVNGCVCVMSWVLVRFCAIVVRCCVFVCVFDPFTLLCRLSFIGTSLG